MKKIILFIGIFTILNATSLNEISSWFSQEKFDKVCSTSVTSHELNRYINNENFINMYAVSCLETDMINRLNVPIIKLRKTQESRANSLYYLTILYQKKLLHHAIADGIENLPKDLPSTDHSLSIIYDLFVNKNYTKDGKFYIFHDKIDKKLSYKVYTQDEHDGYNKLIVETLVDNKKIKSVKYW